MSEDAQDVTSEAPADEVVAETAEATPEADETPAAEAPAEIADEATADGSDQADAEIDEPVAEETPAVGDAFGPVRVARVYVCERGHRTTTLWGEPDTCQARPVRSGPECGLKLYHITELPEQVQKALNPLKASKKASKKS